jgi:arylsulfatase A-like enzyme
MIGRGVALLTLVALTPPALVAWRGGADLDVGLWRLSWFELTGCGIALIGTLLWLCAPTPRGTQARLGSGLALACFAGVAAISWTGGVETDWISLRTPGRPALIGGIGVALALWRSPRELLPGLTGRISLAALGLVAGTLLLVGTEHADRRDLIERMSLSRPDVQSRDVILIVVDTLRADVLGVYGAEPSPSPFIDRLAEQSVVFELAVSQAPSTLPSMASMMTSLHPSAWRGPFGPAETILPPDLPNVATLFREAGYVTAGFQKNPWLRPGTGFERGFDVYELVGGDRAEDRSGEQLVDAVLRWAAVIADQRRSGCSTPFFLYVHFMEPHIDYRPPPDFFPAEARDYRGPFDTSAGSLHALSDSPSGPEPADVEQMKRLYRSEVAYLDSQVARLHDELAASDLWTKDSVVVLMADHGEQFGEHGQFEHGDIHLENIHVPLIIRAPGKAPRRVHQTVRLLDVAPTLIELASLEELPQGEGRSLVAALLGEVLPSVPAVTEQRGNRRVTATRYSLLERDGQTLLFDLRADRDETHDLAEALPGEVRALRQVLSAHSDRGGRVVETRSLPPVGVDRRTREALRALGYLGEP